MAVSPYDEHINRVCATLIQAADALNVRPVTILDIVTRRFGEALANPIQDEEIQKIVAELGIEL